MRSVATRERIDRYRTVRGLCKERARAAKHCGAGPEQRHRRHADDPAKVRHPRVRSDEQPCTRNQMPQFFDRKRAGESRVSRGAVNGVEQRRLARTDRPYGDDAAQFEPFGQRAPTRRLPPASSDVLAPTCRTA